MKDYEKSDQTPIPKLPDPPTKPPANTQEVAKTNRAEEMVWLSVYKTGLKSKYIQPAKLAAKAVEDFRAFFNS